MGTGSQWKWTLRGPRLKNYQQYDIYSNLAIINMFKKLNIMAIIQWMSYLNKLKLQKRTINSLQEDRCYRSWKYIPCPVEKKRKREDGGICKLDLVTILLKVHRQLSIDFRLKICPPHKKSLEERIKRTT